MFSAGQSRKNAYSTRRGQGSTYLFISLVLLAIGMGVAGYGASVGLQALNRLYSGAVNDALGQSEGTEKQVSSDMLKGVVIGAAGIIPLSCGSVMFYTWKARRARAKLKANTL